MATNETNKLIFGTTTYNLKDDSGTASDHKHTKSQITDFPSSMTPSSHTHGNIQNGGTLQTNDITIASGDKLVVTDSSDSSKVARTSVSFDGSTATKCLTQKGTWETFGTSNLTIGTSGTTACAGNDSRLSDARTPSNDSNLVHKTGNETIAGNKTFSNNTTILNSGADTGYIGLNLSSSGSSIALKKQSGSDTMTPVNITANSLSQYYGTSQTPYLIQLGTHGASTDNVKISSDGSINMKNTLNIDYDGLYSDSTITIRSDGDIELHTTGGGSIVNDGNLYVEGKTYIEQSISIDAPGADILIPTNATDGNIAIAPAFSTSKAYAVGDYVIYQGNVYKCTTAHSASAWNYSHFSDITNKIVSTNDIIGKTFEATGSDYAEKFETLEDCPACRFVTLDGEKIKLAQPEDDYILGITSELPSIIGDKMNQGTPVGLLGKLWVECNDTIEVNSFVTSGKDGIATKSDKGYRVMAVDGNKCKVLVK